MAAGVTFEGAHEYLVALLLLCCSVISLMASLILWKGIEDFPRLTTIGRVIGLLIAAALLLPISVLWVLTAKADQPWSKISQAIRTPSAKTQQANTQPPTEPTRNVLPPQATQSQEDSTKQQQVELDDKITAKVTRAPADAQAAIGTLLAKGRQLYMENCSGRYIDTRNQQASPKFMRAVQDWETEALAAVAGAADPEALANEWDVAVPSMKHEDMATQRGRCWQLSGEVNALDKISQRYLNPNLPREPMASAPSSTVIISGSGNLRDRIVELSSELLTYASMREDAFRQHPGESAEDWGQSVGRGFTDHYAQRVIAIRDECAALHYADDSLDQDLAEYEVLRQVGKPVDTGMIRGIALSLEKLAQQIKQQ